MLKNTKTVLTICASLALAACSSNDPAADGVDQTPTDGSNPADNAAGNTDNGGPTDTTTTPGEPSPGPEEVATLVGAGDVASCSSSGDEATAQLLADIPGTIFAAGDLAYESGSETEFANCFNPSWGQVKDRIRPAPGNHEYNTSGAAGYFKYFGAAAGEPGKGYYSYNLGKWHIVALNSNCGSIGGCGKGSPQEQWLRQDLAANPTQCTAAYWHHPLFSSSGHGSDSRTKDLFATLREFGTDVVMVGHDHAYERFAPQDENGNAIANGIRQFMVGTGGKSHDAFPTPLPNSEVRLGQDWGVLKLTLKPTGYDWAFVGVDGATLDQGTAACS